MTWAMTAKNKLSGYIDKQTKFVGHIAVSSTNLPEASCMPVLSLHVAGEFEMDVNDQQSAAV